MDEILNLIESVSEGFPSTFPFLDGGVPRSTSYGVIFLKLIRLARVSSHVDDFNTRNKV